MDDREFKPAKKLVCTRARNRDGVTYEFYEHANNLGDAIRRAKAQSIVYPFSRAEAFLVSEFPGHNRDRR